MTTPAGGLSTRLLVPTVFSVFAIAVANTTSGAIAQPAIAEFFGAGSADVGAIVFGYSATFAIMTASWGPLARRFGLGRCLAFGIALVGLGAAAAVLAPTLPVLIGARIVQGFGAGAIPTLTMALISRRLEGTARARALGINVAAVGIGFALGPIGGGLLLEAFGWRGAMALGLFVLPAIPLVRRLDPGRGDPTTPIDLPGTALLAVGVGAAVVTLNRLPLLGLSPLVAALVGTTVGAIAILVVRSRDRAAAALPLRELAVPALPRAMLLGFAGQVSFFGVLVLAPLVASRVHGVGGVGLGILLVPMAIVIALVSPRNGKVQERIGRRGTTWISMLLTGSTAAVLAVLGPGAPLATLEVGLLVSGLGFGLLSAPLAGEVSRSFGDERRSIALGIYNLAFFMGTASGSAIATSFSQSGLELGAFAGRPFPGASTGLVVLALFPLCALAFDLLRPPTRLAREEAVAS